MPPVDCFWIFFCFGNTFPDPSVFPFIVPDEFVPVYGPESEPKEIQAAPLKESKQTLSDRTQRCLSFQHSEDFTKCFVCFIWAGFLTDCNFDRGACEWVQDHEDDLDWTIKYHVNGATSWLCSLGKRTEVVVSSSTNSYAEPFPYLIPVK